MRKNGIFILKSNYFYKSTAEFSNEKQSVKVEHDHCKNVIINASMLLRMPCKIRFHSTMPKSYRHTDIKISS